MSETATLLRESGMSPEMILLLLRRGDDALFALLHARMERAALEHDHDFLTKLDALLRRVERIIRIATEKYDDAEALVSVLHAMDSE